MKSKKKPTPPKRPSKKKPPPKRPRKKVKGKNQMRDDVKGFHMFSLSFDFFFEKKVFIINDRNSQLESNI